MVYEPRYHKFLESSFSNSRQLNYLLVWFINFCKFAASLAKCITFFSIFTAEMSFIVIKYESIKKNLFQNLSH